MEFEKLMNSLSPSQREAVETTEGVVRVIAGAGSGKTRALSGRFAYLVRELGIAPGHILCVTFTNKAAGEMRSRIRNLTGDNDTGFINTFHGFCVSVLKEDASAVSYPSKFRVLDNSDIDDMLGIIYKERGLDMHDMNFSKARDMIEIKKTIEIPDYYSDMISLSVEDLKHKYLDSTNVRDIIFYGYLYLEKKSFALDFNDLIKFVLYIFSEREDIRLKWQQRLEYIMIDEFQDIDALQYELMEVLCAYHGNLFVVGDPDQTIYSWRGANIKYLLELNSKYPGCKTIKMLENYRTLPPVIKAVNSLIAKNGNRIEKDLIPVRDGGEKPVCHFAKTQNKEAQWIADRIKEHLENGTKPSDIAILYRAKYATRAVEDALKKADIDYEIYGDVRFFERKEIKDALAYMRMLVYADDISFRRVCNVPPRNIGETRISFLERYADENGCSLYQALCDNLEEPLFKNTDAASFVNLVESLTDFAESRPASETLTAVIDRSGYERMLRTEGSQERLDNLAEFKQSICDYEINCGEELFATDYLERAALFTNLDVEKLGKKVRLMTVHTAKGLEFPIVFLCCLNEGVLPSSKTEMLSQMEEERRLAYVAMTRAEDKLYLSSYVGRNINGSPAFPSRFITDIDSGLLDFTEPLPENIISQMKEYIQRTDLQFKDNPNRMAVGCRVNHFKFGDGIIVGMDKDAYRIKFDNIDTVRSITLTAKLTRIAD